MRPGVLDNDNLQSLKPGQTVATIKKIRNLSKIGILPQKPRSIRYAEITHHNHGFRKIQWIMQVVFLKKSWVTVHYPARSSDLTTLEFFFKVHKINGLLLLRLDCVGLEKNFDIKQV